MQTRPEQRIGAAATAAGAAVTGAVTTAVTTVARTFPIHFRPAVALREALKSRYRRRDLRGDLLAGAVVGIVALPLSMALAIASGVAPQQGLYTAIIAGFFIALLGGSRVQVSGPTAAFVVILAPIAAQFGPAGLLMASIIAGMMLVGMGLTGLGSLIEFVPYPVTAGFTAGIGLVIGALQVKDFLGLQIDRMPGHFIERLPVLARALPTLRPQELAIGAVTFAILYFWPRINRKIPAPLVALLTGAGLALILARVIPGFQVDTIATRFQYLLPDGSTGHGIPRQPPLFRWPWEYPGPDGRPLVVDLEMIRALMPPAFAIAMLGAIESLLSAVVADGMSGHKHDPDAELLAQGVGNIVAPFFGGFAATGAIARTATNVRAGARSPVAAMVHSGVVLVSVLVLAPMLGYLPMASMAALLLLVAWNMSEVRQFARMLRRAPGQDVVVLLTCFGLTVVFDMVVSVTAGVLLAALLFMKRMAEVSGISKVEEGHPSLDEPLPAGVVMYEILGPLFFGVAQKAMHTLNLIDRKVRIVILDLRSVPAIDAAGIENLDLMRARLNKDGVLVILAGLRPQPARALVRAGWHSEEGRLRVFRSFDNAIAFARERAAALTAARDRKQGRPTAAAPAGEEPAP